MEHLDEGTIHAWLDGALSPDESRDVERHVAECAICAASVAEARGFIAASSRILSALDSVPGGVLPVTAAAGDGGTQPADDLSAQRARRRSGAARATGRRPWWRHPGFAAAAAVAFVAAGSWTVIGLLPNGDDVTVGLPVARSAPEPFAPVGARADSSGALRNATANSDKAELLATRPPAAQPVPSRDLLARTKESAARAADAAPSPAPTVVTDATRSDASKALNEMKIGPVVPSGRASVRVDTGPTRRAADEESRQRGQLAAATVSGVAAKRALADSIVEKARSGRGFVPAAPLPARANEGIADRARARPEPGEEIVATASLVGCYAIRLVAVGGGPMAIAAVRLPTHVALDSMRVAGSGDVQYEARDVSPDAERVPGTYRWRPTGRRSFDFLIVLENGTQAFAAVVGGNPTATGGPVTPMPAGAPVRLAATRERCR